MFIPGKHARHLNFKSASTEQNLRKETKPTIFEQTQFEMKKAAKKKLKSHLKQQWTTLPLATTMKNVYSTRKISNLATKSIIFQLKPLEPKKKIVIF